MSGYADKEYLKAAIDLKAASYIEKPFRTRELRDVLERAASLRKLEQERASREADLLRRAEAGAPLLRSEAALMLVQNDPADERVRRAVAASGLALSASTPLAIALVRAAGAGAEDSTVDRDRLAEAVDAECAAAGLQGVVALQGPECAVIVFAGRSEGDGHGAQTRALADTGMTVLMERVLQRAGAVGGDAAGRARPAETLQAGRRRSPCVAGVSAAVTGLSRAREAYAGASSALDAAFFLGAGSVRHDSACPRNPLVQGSAAASPFGHAVDDFQACLDREDGEGALSLLRGQAQAMAASGSRDTFLAREFLTRLLLRLVAWCERRGIDPFSGEESVRRLSERIERAGTLVKAAAPVESAVGAAFQRISEREADGKVVAEIKRAIHRGYSSPGLSIEEIAQKAGVSSTYACRLFKEATGETIHRYMTAWRLERAKDLLLDPRQPKMAEVAALAGFSDANYFARAFRRATGRSPSEFREGIRP